MKKPIKITLISLGVLLALIAIAICFFFLLIEPGINILGSPELELDRLTSCTRTVRILDKNGDPIDDALYEKNKVYVKIDDLPAYVPQAFIAIEDKRFYSHSGIDGRRLASALFSNMRSGSFREGASTITQQLIKNTHLSNEKTIRRKLSEMRLARALEREFTKDEILEKYFNILYFGSGIYGLGTASRVLFDKPASELTVAQAAALASIINNPSRYSPYHGTGDLEKRKDLVLSQMHDQGYLDDMQYSEALVEPLSYGKFKQNQFTESVIRSACAEYGCTEKELFYNNTVFRTAYDPDMAAAARGAIQTMDGFDGNIRVLVLDNASGGVMCDETNREKYIDPKRSPASTIKPFIAYAPALESGITPLSQFYDGPTDFGGYSPKNYRDVYRGYISLRDGLIYSSNIVAVTLLDKVGIEYGRSVVTAFGLPLSRDDGTLALALGGMKDGVRLLELANAYRMLANGGIWSDTHVFFRDDKVRVSDASRRIGEDTAFILTDILCDCAKSGTAKCLSGYNNIAAKTGTNGTSKGNLDCYCIAYTPDVTVAVWLGAESSTLMDNSVTGATACGLVKYMCDCGAIKTDKEFIMPDSVAYYEVDERALNSEHAVYLADPLLPKKNRRCALFSKRHLPVKRHIDIIDFFDGLYWERYGGR